MPTLTQQPDKPPAIAAADVKEPTRMRAGYGGGKCEGCRLPILVGQTYYFMPGERATVLCEKCKGKAVADKPPAIDQLRTLTLPEVIARTGMSRATICRLLARDVMARTPGYNFAAPVRLPGQCGPKAKLRWREQTLVAWMREQERRTA